MRLTTLGQVLLVVILLLAFWKPLAALWQRIGSSRSFADVTAIDLMVFIALALLAMRVFYTKRPGIHIRKEDR
jgi:hypothetical protein